MIAFQLAKDRCSSRPLRRGCDERTCGAPKSAAGSVTREAGRVSRRAAPLFGPLGGACRSGREMQ
eukprot:164284-Prymnesium_polylepis.1